MTFFRKALVITASTIAAGALAPTAPQAATRAPARQAATVRLPAPTGHYPVGTTALRLVDRSRHDPWRRSQPYRELMVSVVYPARDAGRYPVASQMPKGVAAGFDELAGPLNYGVPPHTVNWSATRTHSHQGAPAAAGRHPVLLYSPGAGDVRSWDTTLVEQLASEGYVVVTIDHTYEAAAVEFPHHRVVNSVLPAELAKAQKHHTIPKLLEKVLTTRVKDTRFVLNALGLHDVGMFGQSAGGFAAAEAMYEDHRIKAGIDMDGTLSYLPEADGTHLAPVARHGLTRPFLLMGSAGKDGSDHNTEASWKAFWSHDRGWRADLTLDDSEHGSYTDAEALLPQLADRLPKGSVPEQIGTVDPARAIAAEKAYISSFFDRFLNGHDDHLLDGHPAGYPVTFIQ